MSTLSVGRGPGGGRGRGRVLGDQGRAAWASLLLVLLLSAPAPAQPPAGGDPVLGGPPVPEEVARTLVGYNVSGRFQKVEGRPEEAALLLLNLDPAVREHTREVVAERDAELQRLLVDNIDTVKEIADAVLAGDGASVQRLGKELYDRSDPTHARDPLLAPLEKVLPEDRHADLKRLVDDYWAAWVKAERRAGAKETEAQAQERLALTLFQEEIRRVYDRTLRPFRDRIARIFQVADPTPEQRAAIREAAVEFIRETRLKPSPEQRDQVARKVYLILDEERRIKLFAAALSQL
jgi:hypothetical protein